MQVDKQEFAWTCMIARSNENKSCMRVDESWPEINQKNAQKLCWACCYKVETASRSKLVNNSHATLMTGQMSKNSRWLASEFETAQSWCELTGVDASWRSNASETCNSHQLASSFDRGLTNNLPMRTCTMHWAQNREIYRSATRVRTFEVCVLAHIALRMLSAITPAR